MTGSKTDLSDVVLQAILNSPHEISSEEIVLRFSVEQDGHNVLSQLKVRIAKALFENTHPAVREMMRELENIVIDATHSGEKRDTGLAKRAAEMLGAISGENERLRSENGQLRSALKQIGVLATSTA